MTTNKEKGKYVVAIANQKGGVGKTTTAVNLATAAAAIGMRTLLIDLDPQGNASTGLGIDGSTRTPSSYELLIGAATLQESIKQTRIPLLGIIPSTVNLAAAEVELVGMPRREFVLSDVIKSADIQTKYDICIIDCPPSLGLLTVNALVSASGVLIPLQCEFFALEGLVHLMNTINLIRKSYNTALSIDGIVLTMLDKRNRLSALVESDVRQTFGELVFQASIPRNVKLSEATSHGEPALIYDSKCYGSIAYMMLAKEWLGKKKFLNLEERKYAA